MQENESPTSISAAPAEVPPATRSGVWNAVSWFRDLVFSVLIAIVMIVFIYQPVKVEGTSMMPTLTNEERIFINKLTYKFGLGSIERGDTVVFWYPQDTTKSYIKRVIGTPGDRIRVDGGQVYVNGQALSEDYVPKDYRDESSWRSRRPVAHRGAGRRPPRSRQGCAAGAAGQAGPGPANPRAPAA